MTTEIKVQNSTITAYTTIDESWNNAIPNGFWGTGYVLVKDNLYITLSENHELFEYLIDTLNWKLI